jgi:hypothetical protein
MREGGGDVGCHALTPFPSWAKFDAKKTPTCMAAHRTNTSTLATRGETEGRSQKCPVKARIITIKRTKPSPPLGQYPQPELYGQAGNAPMSRRIRMINRIVLMVSPFLNYIRARPDFGRNSLGTGNIPIRPTSNQRRCVVTGSQLPW